MKYLVNRETKEHIICADMAQIGLMKDWDVVEADEEGWITQKGVDCPLPEDCQCEVQTKDGKRLFPLAANRWDWWFCIGDTTITHYRPILETAEMAACKESLHVESVFDRLNHAVVAAQSIPAILAEINSLLPDGYHVTKRIEPTRE